MPREATECCPKSVHCGGTPDQDGKDALGGGVYATSLGLEPTCSGSVPHNTAILETEASANLVGANWPGNRNAILKALGRPLAKITPAFASFRYGDGRVGDIHRAAGISIAIVGYIGHFMAYVVDADTPALLGGEALETLGGHLNFRERVLTLESPGADIPLEMSPVGHYLLNVVDFPKSIGAGKPDHRNDGIVKRVVNDRGVVRKDAFFFMDVASMAKMRPAGESGPSRTLLCLVMKQFVPVGLHPGGKLLRPLRLDGFQSETNDSAHQQASATEPADKRISLPIHSALASTALGDAVDGAKSDPRKIARRLHVNWGHASAQQLKRAMAEAEGNAGGLIPLVDDVVRECEICRTLHVAPAIQVAGTSSASPLEEKVPVGLFFLGDLVALHVLHLFPR